MEILLLVFDILVESWQFDLRVSQEENSSSFQNWNASSMNIQYIEAMSPLSPSDSLSMALYSETKFPSEILTPVM